VVAQIHKFDEVFNAAFKLGPTKEEQDLWQEKQRFVYSVFDLKLKKDCGKTLVRQHQHMYNAQRIWTDFVNYMKTSTKPQIASLKLLAWLLLSKYDSNWKGNTRNYILYWHNCMQEYDTYCTDSNDHFTDGQKLKMLQSAVHDVPDLRQVY
jgi:hypothetical protein